MEENIILEPISVYVKINANNEITDINSSIFLQNLIGWIKIDEGFGDKYAHAQGHYLDKPISTMDGTYNYILSNGKIVAV